MNIESIKIGMTDYEYWQNQMLSEDSILHLFICNEYENIAIK